MYQILMPDMLSATPNVGAGPLSNTTRRGVASETAFCMWQGEFFSLPCPVWRRELLTAMACPKDEDFRLNVKHETKKKIQTVVTWNMQRMGITFEYGYFANQQTTASDALRSHERCSFQRVALCGFGVTCRCPIGDRRCLPDVLLQWWRETSFEEESRWKTMENSDKLI